MTFGISCVLGPLVSLLRAPIIWFPGPRSPGRSGRGFGRRGPSRAGGAAAVGGGGVGGRSTLPLGSGAAQQQWREEILSQEFQLRIDAGSILGGGVGGWGPSALSLSGRAVGRQGLPGREQYGAPTFRVRSLNWPWVVCLKVTLGDALDCYLQLSLWQS